MLAALVLTGCGGGSGGDEVGSTSAASTLSVSVAACDAAAYDSGKLLYIVTEQRCAISEAGTTIQLRYGSPATEAVSLSLKLGQEQPGVDIPGLGKRQVGLFRSGQWRSFPNERAWIARDGAGLVVLNGSLYLLGGWTNGPVTSEVWRTDDVANWTFLGNAPWKGRHGAAWLSHKNQMWVIGGDLFTDVWSSPDGIQWEQATADAGFGPRYTPNAAVIADEIVLYAGQDWTPIPWCNDRPDCVARGNRSVWKSADGKTWTEILAQVPWEGRALIHGSVVHQGQIYLIGGGLKVAPPNERYQETFVEYTDIWSSPDGIRWTQRLPSGAFPGRSHFSVAHTAKGCFVSDGSVGTQAALSNDLFFAADCIRFERLPVPQELPVRHASSLVDFNGSLVLLGGPNYGNAGTSVWQYFP
ncbi:MAG: hypothetical protein ACK4S6_08965 [Roseateles asaccharophilus]|uniref:kelch repeat-containing protein n=1 Tax=Roseateles asaccharophilus TaxID=582607 RepID=UPI0010608EF6|nr:kelch repeat-containing protein [Roseateles asaccharophilus]MDN3545735.1 kelch repeat-containing protein [Roseateles asaccharophilus]